MVLSWSWIKLLNLTLKLLKDLNVLTTLLAEASMDQILDFFLLWDCIKKNVIEYELKVTLYSCSFVDLVVFRECLSHNCNKHVKEMNLQKEARNYEKNPKIWSDFTVSFIIFVKTKLS